MFRLIKRCFLTSLAFLAGVNSLICVSMSNRKCETRPQISNVNGMVLCFFPLVLKQVNAAVVATISIIHS